MLAKSSILPKKSNPGSIKIGELLSTFPEEKVVFFANSFPSPENFSSNSENGILNVSAKDKATGKEQNIKIEASSGLSDDEIERMKKEAEANAESDKQVKEAADKINAADQMIFQTEKQLKEFGEK